MIVAALALAFVGLVQEPVIPSGLAELEACVDRVEGAASCPGLDDETAIAEHCMSSPEHNATHKTLNACIVRSSNRCFEQSPEATTDSFHVQGCLARARGGVRNAVLRMAQAGSARLAEGEQRELWHWYGQAVVRIEQLAQEGPDSQAGMQKTAAWIVLAHQLSAAEETAVSE